MPTLKWINRQAGTDFRWSKELVEIIKGVQMANVKLEPEEVKEAPAKPEGGFEDHPDIAKALAEGWKLKDVENGRNAARRMSGKIQAAQYRYGPDSSEVQAAINAANRVAVMLTNARAAYNRIKVN